VPGSPVKHVPFDLQKFTGMLHTEVREIFSQNAMMKSFSAIPLITRRWK
jgi:hypothetical protein